MRARRVSVPYIIMREPKNWDIFFTRLTWVLSVIAMFLGFGIFGELVNNYNGDATVVLGALIMPPIFVWGVYFLILWLYCGLKGVDFPKEKFEWFQKKRYRLLLYCIGLTFF